MKFCGICSIFLSVMNIVTRIAPSPTGQMHIGTVRTALFNFLLARHHGGEFLVRIEDTDKSRNQPEWVEAIWRDFAWVGLEADKRFVQSEHLPRHRELLKKLVEEGSAYISKELAKDGSGREVAVVRLKNPGQKITFNDLVRGEVSFDTTDLGDFVIARSIDDPLYHFAVVVDDHDAGVTHVMRAEEHLSNTPRQILLHQALGFPLPTYAHIPLILAPDRSKLSKRKHSASLEHYQAQGYLPEALINYLCLLGWNPGTEEEIFTVEELIQRFNVEQIQKSGAIFDEKKMRWVNRAHLQKLSDEEFLAGVKKFLSADLLNTLEENGRLAKLLPELRERVEVFGDLKTMEDGGEFAYYISEPEYKTELLLWKKDQDKNNTKQRLEKVLAIIAENSDQLKAWNKETVKATLWPLAEAEGRGEILWPLRVALSGREKSPDPFSLAEILGREEVEKRVKVAMEKLS